MNYILNSLEDIRKVYTPDIECLNTPLDWIPFTFCGIEKTIFESMRFYQYYYYGDDYEKEDLSLKDFNFKNKSHKYSGINYDYLLRNIDLNVFKTELEKLITKEENHFIFKTNEELNKAAGEIEYKKRLRKNVESLVSSSKFLKSILDMANEFDKILINKFIVSYRNVYDSLKVEHEQDILPAIIFNSEHFKIINNLKKPKDTNEVVNQDKQRELNYLNMYLKPNPKMKSYRESIFRNFMNEKEEKKMTYNEVNEFLSQPIKKLTDCGFYKVLQNKYPEVEKQQSIIATLFRTHLKSTNIKYDIITVGTHYYNFCDKIGLINHLEKTELKSGTDIAKLLNYFSTNNDINLKELNIKNFENNHTYRGNLKSGFNPFTDLSNKKVTIILMKLNLI